MRISSTSEVGKQWPVNQIHLNPSWLSERIRRASLALRHVWRACWSISKETSLLKATLSHCSRSQSQLFKNLALQLTENCSPVLPKVLILTVVHANKSGFALFNKTTTIASFTKHLSSRRQKECVSRSDSAETTEDKLVRPEVLGARHSAEYFRLHFQYLNIMGRYYMIPKLPISKPGFREAGSVV